MSQDWLKSWRDIRLQFKVRRTKHSQQDGAAKSFRFKLYTNFIELFGITIDKKLIFTQHISALCKKINNQVSVITSELLMLVFICKCLSKSLLISVIIRFGYLVSTETLLGLYKAFSLPHFNYCFTVLRMTGHDGPISERCHIAQYSGLKLAT